MKCTLYDIEKNCSAGQTEGAKKSCKVVQHKVTLLSTALKGSYISHHKVLTAYIRKMRGGYSKDSKAHTQWIITQWLRHVTIRQGLNTNTSECTHDNQLHTSTYVMDYRQGLFTVAREHAGISKLPSATNWFYNTI